MREIKFRGKDVRTGEWRYGAFVPYSEHMSYIYGDYVDKDEVWEFLNHYGCKSNPLYQCGYTRVGCVGCPMAGGEAQIRGFEKYPRYKEAYIRAFQRMVEARKESGLKNTSYWTSGEAVFDWWVSGKQISQEEGQLDFEELEEVLP
jgi:phosphoadenosine phosphosulfate reductase